jgi:glucose-1-phosphate thymidylyltransferase
MSKQLLPVYDKPMIYYPLSVLLLAGIREVLIISTPQDLPKFREVLGDGSRLGCRFDYVEQAVPNGLAQAFVLGEKFIGSDDVCLVLGDNIFYSAGFGDQLKSCRSPQGGIVFAYHVKDPERFGVVEFDTAGKAVSIEEKPTAPKSSFAVPGLYFYDNAVVVFKIGCIEEIAWRRGYIDDAQLLKVAEPIAKSGYGVYLKALVAGPR